MTTNHPAYEPMITAALPVLRRYHADLHTHDATTLGHLEASTPIAWMVHVDGTHLISATASKDAIDGHRDAFDPRTGTCRATGQVWHLWNGRTLEPCSHEQAFAAIADWRTKLRRDDVQH